MEDSTTTGLHDLNLASRKAEEAACRRFEAAEWLESLVGPLGISREPSEREFISCLRNGLFLCNAINKINPGAVPKVVENSSYMHSFNREPQLPPAYQYFENVRNFLVAVQDLNLPAFEASDIERDILEAGSTAKVVDCILALKSYHEWKQSKCGNGFYKPARSPMVMHTASRPSRPSAAISSDSCRRLEMSTASEKQPHVDGQNQNLEDSIVKVLAEYMVGAKENIDENLLVSFRNGSQDSFKLLEKIFSSCLKEQQNKFPELKSLFKDFAKGGIPDLHPTSSSPEDLTALGNSQCCRACLTKGTCNHRHLLKMQEKELLDLKTLLSSTKREFKDFEFHLQKDLEELGNQVQEMSSAALGYHRVVKENRKLYNMVQDLKGNIRVYCRIRPAFSYETKNVIEFIGEDGSLVLSDPSKPQKDGRKKFQFNHVFGPTATQDEVYKDTQPLIRSVMDGYNVCIFAYGQTGSGKTYTMSGPSGGSTRGINYLALEDLFQISKTRKDTVSYEIHVQMVEIYNEQVRDLLAEDSSTTKLEIRSCAGENGLSLPDATLHSVKSTSHVLALMKLGEFNRAVSSTALNNRSSRSHSILTVHVHGKDTSGSILRSCLHLVDLAGSERVDKSEVTGDRLKEALYINKSLSCLGDVITALAQKCSHIPYRNSKLTHLLQDSLGGHAKTLMFAHVSPEGDSFGETVSTLKFAQRVSTVELGAARVNKESNEVMQLKLQIENLKKALANKEAQKPMTERTPPRTRRLSIENGSTTKTEKVKASANKERTPMRTPPRTRRLSIENGSTSRTEKVKALANKERTPMNDRTPTRTRRLSIENGSTAKTEKVKALANKEAQKPIATTEPDNNNIQIKASDSASNPLPQEAVSRQKHGQFQDAEAVSKPFGYFSSNGSSTMDDCGAAPRSPTSFSFQKQAIKVDSRTQTQIPSLQPPKTPEPQIFPSNEVQMVMEIDLPLPTESQTTSGKASQIRKSLRTIGKLINGSEKRKQRTLKETRPIRGASNVSEARSPLTANARTLRRQSLTGSDSRSSLGGKSIESSENDNTNVVKSPPSVQQPRKTGNRFV